jgi:holliday junction DNA helicase RuvA
MIGRLRGKVEAQGEDWVILDVGGVGYEIFCSSRVLAWAAAQEGEVIFAIETHVREDQIRLFGFQSETERQWFRLLQSVQGVGARVALSILGTLTLQDIANAIALGDKAAVSRAPHVGPKLAVRIVTELKDKAPVLSLASISASPATTGKGKGGAAASSANAEAISALVNLGYQQIQASVAVAAASRELGDGASTEALIRRGLKELAR